MKLAPPALILFAVALVGTSAWTSTYAADVASPPPAAAEFDRGDVVDVLPDGSPLYSRIQANSRVFTLAGTAGRSPRTADSIMIQKRSKRAQDEPDGLQALLSKTDEELGELARARGVIGKYEFVEEIADVRQRGEQVRSKLESARASSSKAGRSGSHDPSHHQGEESHSGPVAVRHVDSSEKPHAKHAAAEETAQVPSTTSSSSSGSRKLLGGGDFCPDGRIAIKNTAQWPYSANVVLGYASSSSSNALDWNACSAALVGQTTALSAAHCFWDLEQGSWYENYWWAPGYDSANAADPSPLGMWHECYLATIPTAFTQETSYNSAAEFWDFAVMTFDVCTGPIRNGVDPSKPGQGLALTGFIYNLDEQDTDVLYSRGYPGSSQTCGRVGTEGCEIRQWGDWGEFSDMTADFLNSEQLMLSKGHSGSGIYMYWTDGEPYVVCIATSIWPCEDPDGVSEKSRCRKISELVRDFILDVSDDFSV